MRTIKFRAWHKDGKEMLYPDLQSDCFKWIDEGQPIELMQFTGLKDKNGKEIYEGDLVRFEDLAGRENRTYEGAVEFNEFEMRFGVRTWQRSCNQFYTAYTEVIGNIHENPELLK